MLQQKYLKRYKQKEIYLKNTKKILNLFDIEILY